MCELFLLLSEIEAFVVLLSVFTLFSHHMYDDVIKGLLNGGQKYRATTTRKAQKIMMVDGAIAWCKQAIAINFYQKVVHTYHSIH